YVDGRGRCEGVKVAVEVRLKLYSMLADLAQPGEAEHLKPAGVGKDRIGPRHESMQSPELADELVSGPQIEVIGIGEDGLGVELFGEVVLGESLDGRLRSHGHENGRFDVAVDGVKNAGTGSSVGALGENFKGDLRQRS